MVKEELEVVTCKYCGRKFYVIKNATLIYCPCKNKKSKKGSKK